MNYLISNMNILGNHEWCSGDLLRSWIELIEVSMMSMIMWKAVGNPSHIYNTWQWEHQKYGEPCGLPPGSLLNTALTIASMPTRHSLNALCIATEAEIQHLPLRSLRFLPLLYSLNLIIPIYSLLLPNLAKMALYIINSYNFSIVRAAFFIFKTHDFWL